MSIRPTLFQAIVARLRGEIPGTVLQAYQRAGLQVYELMDQVERRRLRHTVDGLDAWAVPPAERAELVCAWIALALQSLGDTVVHADYQQSPATAGYVPAPTADQVLRFYTPVEAWLNLARQAHANPAFTLGGRVPAQLPRWGAAPPSGIPGLIPAMRVLEGHVAGALGFLTRAEPRNDAHRQQLARIEQLYAAAASTARYAEALCDAAPGGEARLHGEMQVRRAIEMLYLAGQLAADPHLAEVVVYPLVAPANGASARLAEPVVEALAHPGLSVRDVNDLEVRPNSRIKHGRHGVGTYLGIGARGSALMRRADGVVVAFTDRDFRRVYDIRGGT